MCHRVVSLLHHPPGFAKQSGMYPLVTALGSSPIVYAETWRKVQDYFWRPGYQLKCWGDAYYGSGWNALIPWVDKWRLCRRIPMDTDLVHFIWAEFASPRRENWFRAADGVAGEKSRKSGRN